MAEPQPAAAEPREMQAPPFDERDNKKPDKSFSKRASYYLRHPYARAFVAIFISVLNALIYMEDPIAHSKAEAELPIMGNAGTFLVNRYKRLNVGALLIKLVMALSCFIAGLVFGKKILHDKILRDWIRIKMFSEDKGSFFMMGISTVLFLFVGSTIYNPILEAVDPEGFKTSEITGFLGIHNENFMKIAATGTWFGDLITMIMVIDAMLQQRSRYAHNWIGAREFYNRGNTRIRIFWSFFLTTTSIFLILIILGDWESLDLALPSTTEYSRALLASTITLFDLLIVIQDWEFPTFDSPQEVKIMGTNLHSLDFSFMKNIHVKITGKWFNYGIIFCVMGLDMNMFKNQIVYRPAAFGQYTDPDHHIYTISQEELLKMSPEEMAAISWENRQGFTDTPMRARYLGLNPAQLISAFLPILFGFVFFFTLLLKDASKRRRADNAIALSDLEQQRLQEPKDKEDKPELKPTEEKPLTAEAWKGDISPDQVS